MSLAYYKKISASSVASVKPLLRPLPIPAVVKPAPGLVKPISIGGKNMTESGSMSGGSMSGGSMSGGSMGGVSSSSWKNQSSSRNSSSSTLQSKFSETKI